MSTLGPGNPATADPTGSAVPVGGGTRCYQAWYRNTQNFCTSATYNDSDGLGIVWSP
jgi:hypothetical protein